MTNGASREQAIRTAEHLWCRRERYGDDAVVPPTSSCAQWRAGLEEMRAASEQSIIRQLRCHGSRRPLATRHKKLVNAPTLDLRLLGRGAWAD